MKGKGPTVVPLAATQPHHRDRANWLAFSLQVALVAGIELSDDFAHALTGWSNAQRLSRTLDAV